MAAPILLIHSSAQIGGSERQILELARCASKCRRIVLVLIEGRGELLEDFKAITELELTCLNKRGILDWVRVYKEIDQLVRQVSPAAIYTFLPVPNILGFLVGKCRGIKTIVWGVRTSRFERFEFGIKREFIAFCLKHLSKNVDLLIANSEKGLRDARNHGIWSKQNIVINNGVPLPRFGEEQRISLRRSSRESMGLKDRTLVIGTVARIVPWKGHEVLIDAFHMLSKANIDVFLVIVGEGEDNYVRDLKKRATNLGLENLIYWAGKQPNAEYWLPVFDVFVLASTSGEGFSNAVGEAMAIGLPIIGSDVGGLKEQILDGGSLFTPGCSEDLAHKINLFRDKKRRERLGHNGKVRVRELYSVETMTTKTLEMLDNK